MNTYDVVKPIEAGLLVDAVLVKGTAIEPGAVIQFDPAKQPLTIALYIDGGWLVKRPAIRFPDDAQTDANRSGE